MPSYLTQPVRCRLDDVEHLLAEGAHQLLGIDRPDAADHPGARDIFRCRRVNRVSEVLRNFALYCWPWVRSLTHSPDAVIHSPAEIIAAMADYSDHFAVAARLDPQHAVAIPVVVVCDALNQAREYFLA